MSVGSWTPDTPSAVDPAFVERCLAIVQRGSLEQLADQFDDLEKQRFGPCMRLDRQAWEAALADCTDEELRQLIFVFTRAEALIPGWEAGEQSPAIWCNKLLRARGGKLGKDDLLWIRANTDNRFIPNGGL